VALLSLWFGVEARRRGRAYVALALVTGVVAGVVLTLAAGARATDAAYERFVDRQAIPDVEFDSLSDTGRATLSRLPGVRAVGAYAPLFAAPARRDVVVGDDFIMFAGVDRGYGQSVDRPIVVQGRLPRRDANDEVAVNEAAAAKYGLGVAMSTKLRSLAPDEGDALFAGRFGDLTFHGPAPTVRVVGVVRTRLDLGHAGYAGNYFLATPAFYRAYGTQMLGYAPQLDVRLAHPADAARYVTAARHAVAKEGAAAAQQFNGRIIQQGLTSVRDATGVQALALALVALAALCAAMFVLAQMIARGVGSISDEFPTLRAIGLTDRRRAALVAWTFLPSAVVGALVAIVIALVASPLFPTGVARRTGPDPGMHFDALVFLVGALVLVALIVGTAAVSAYRWKAVSVVADGPRATRMDRAAAALPPSPRIGVRWAFPRRGTVTGSGRTAIAGTVLAVAAVVATLTYWSGVDHLVTTPSAYGRGFDVDAGGGQDVGEVSHIRDTLLQNHAVGDVALARIMGDARIGGAVGDLYGFESVRGHIGPTVFQGRVPVVRDEIMLGTKTAQALHKHVGQTVELVVGPGAPTATLRIVGVGLLPTIEGDQFAKGGALTRSGLEGIAPGQGYLEAIYRLRPGVDRSRAVAVLHRQGLVSSVATPPGGVRNLDLVRSYPLWLGAFLAALGVAAVLQALWVSARRRSHQVGVLRALGFTRAQVVGAGSTQGAALWFVGALLGIPLGIAVGRAIWAASAHQLGVGDGVGVPAGIVSAVVVAGLVLLLISGAVAGWWAGRASPARALRVA
jgi:hypothetical protein